MGLEASLQGIIACGDLVNAEPGVSNQQRVEIAPRLILTGLGGSVDSTIFETPGTIYWKGFPYTEDQLQEKFKCLLSPQIEQQSETKNKDLAFDSILLVTHSGPAYTSTTDILYGKNHVHIQSGSVAMSSYLKQIKKESNLSSLPILAHIHGHSHNGLGLSHQIPGHPTINPGALKNGKFIHISFQQQNQEDVPWKLNGIHFITL
ncbi:hypothetical protein DSO57_1026877 [Entomophthora muscae]|uniref:Uncharacterized protein n=1 Tax=Entomophthora muscae TaxID=34485 RepID=A0ACC2U0G6_9FUNG|nr:hypothetical protein DSO57_1026877 [Entomophthora muscae]